MWLFNLFIDLKLVDKTEIKKQVIQKYLLISKDSLYNFSTLQNNWSSNQKRYTYNCNKITKKKMKLFHYIQDLNSKSILNGKNRIHNLVFDMKLLNSWKMQNPILHILLSIIKNFLMRKKALAMFFRKWFPTEPYWKTNEKA